jgi:hypothetical protein
LRLTGLFFEPFEDGGRVIKSGLVTTLLLLLASAGAAADEKPAPGKDLCLFEAKFCPGGEEYNIAEKYDRLVIEVAKGLAVYSPEELKHLKSSKRDAEDVMTLLGLGCH